jgi:polar amino acid transport system permease protein
VLALVKELNKRPLNFVYSVYTNFFRGTPLLVQLILIYSGLPQFGISFSVLESAILALGLNEGAYLAEIIRSGISSVPRGQVEAAKAIGMPYLTTMRYVVLPQAFRITIPPIGNEFNGLLKSTSLVSVISMQELLRTTEELIQQSFRVMELFVVATIYYLVMTGAWSILQARIERRLGVSLARPSLGAKRSYRRRLRIPFGLGR